jgi:tetrapyrrole methylase family protein / MazG family protein
MAITVVGLGPASLDRVDARTLDILRSAPVVILRTAHHPAAIELASLREVITCDDLYDENADFDSVYRGIVDRVLAAAEDVDVVYAVPGSPSVGERTVPLLVDLGREAGHDVELLSAASFLEDVFAAVGLDPITDGAQIVDARDLPDPLPFHLPTIITQVDSMLRASDLAVALGRTLPDDIDVVVLDRLGDSDGVVQTMSIASLARYPGGPRTSVFVPAADVGVLGLIATNRILRSQCPWDREQTHHTLLTHLVEEAYEAADALGSLPVEAPGGDPDFGVYAEVEDELGDLLLQVIFHATLAAEAGAFDIDEVAEINRRKLVRRHPHVFSDVEVDGAAGVLANWERIKQDEKARSSLMDDIPTGMPGVARAMKVQKRAASVKFDWIDTSDVFAVLRGEIDELQGAEGDLGAVTDELGDVLFSAINLARHLNVDPETALRRSVDRFIERFRLVEESVTATGRTIDNATVDELDDAWQDAKRAIMEQGTQSP